MLYVIVAVGICVATFIFLKRTRRAFSLERVEDVRILFRGFLETQLDFDTSHYECWGGDGGPGLYGRTFYVSEDSYDVANKIVQYLKSKGFVAEVNLKFTDPSVRSNAFQPDWIGISPCPSSPPAV